MGAIQIGFYRISKCRCPINERCNEKWKQSATRVFVRRSQYLRIESCLFVMHILESNTFTHHLPYVGETPLSLLLRTLAMENRISAPAGKLSIAPKKKRKCKHVFHVARRIIDWYVFFLCLVRTYVYYCQRLYESKKKSFLGRIMMKIETKKALIPRYTANQLMGPLRSV